MNRSMKRFILWALFDLKMTKKFRVLEMENVQSICRKLYKLKLAFNPTGFTGLPHCNTTVIVKPLTYLVKCFTNINNPLRD